MLVDAHDRRRCGVQHAGQPDLGRPQPALDIAPGRARGCHREGQLVQLSDGEGPEHGRVAVPDRAGGAGEGGGDVGDATGDDDREDERQDEQGCGGDDPAGSRRVRLENEAGERAEWQGGSDEEQQVRPEGNRRDSPGGLHGGLPSKICTNRCRHRSLLKDGRTRCYGVSCVIAV